MPVEIRELYIKINIEGGVTPQNQSQGSGTPGQTPPPSNGGGDQEKWAQECVEQVMQLIARKGER